MTSLTGRSRKRKLVSYDHIGNGEGNVVIRDSITAYCDAADGIVTDIIVGDRQPPHEGDISIHYEKPENAFAHPNGNAMKMALKWILGRTALILNELDGSIGLLEMFCGCGAHTVPIAKLCSKIEYISCVEIDERLIMACQKNLQLNQIHAEFRRPGEGLEAKGRLGGPVVQLFRGDAGDWAKKSRHKMNVKKKTEKERCTSNTTWYGRDYAILLVDPPRDGLSSDVCRMAIEGSFQHLVYISCGKEALQRDLVILSCAFEVVNCTLIDLFPRIDAVESLVHLRRRK